MSLLNNTTTYNETSISIILQFFDQAKSAVKFVVIFIAVLTILGNSLVLFATWREKSLHQPNKYFIACLAFADLLVGIIVGPLSFEYKIFPDVRITSLMSVHLCRFITWMDAFTLTASIYSLTFISFDRYLKISKPLQYKSRMTTSKSLKIIITVWFISTVIATYVAIPYSGSSKNDWVVGFICPVDRKRIEGFEIIVAVTAFFVLTIVILVMYAFIFMVIRKRQKNMRNGQLGEILRNQNKKTVFLQDIKVIIMLFIVVGAFILCWGPHFIYALLRKYHPDFFIHWNNTSQNYWRSFYIKESVISTLPYFNSLCNPIIYGCLDQTYKKAFKNLFHRMMCRTNSRRHQPPDEIQLRRIRIT